MNYYNDCNRKTFYVKTVLKQKRYYINIDNEYIEVKKEVFNILKSSYRTSINIQKREVGSFNSYNEELNYSTSFIYSSDKSYINRLMMKEVKECIYKTIKNMKPEYKNIAILLYIKQYSKKEVIEILNISKSTLYNRLNKINKILRDALKDII